MDKNETGLERGLVVLFSATLLLSAGLLFWVQPFVGKLLLPRLGGAPAVWNAAMLFFQAGLLGGYAYAHVTSLWLKPVVQARVHVGLLVLSLAGLPIGISGQVTTALVGVQPPTGGDPVWWLLGVLTISIGVPFALLSASAPILQRWFATSGHADAGNPYFLYAASNLGSVVALLGFPLVAEPLLALDGQSQLWSIGFIVLLVLICVCAFAVRRSWRGGEMALPEVGQSLAVSPSWGRRFYWVILVFSTTSLMLGLTTYITTDVAAVPLLWVIPLTLYLLTFVIVFARRVRVREIFVRRVLIAALVLFVPIWLTGGRVLPWPVWAFSLALLFFMIALTCHAILARRRPHKMWLTEFYLWMAVGGVLGGAFNALAAPVWFDTVVEFPLMLTLAAALALAVPNPENPRASQGFAAVLILGLASAMAYVNTGDLRNPNLLWQGRNFFGALRITQDPEIGIRKLVYGNTIHGIQAQDPAFATEPLSYYGRKGPVGDVFAALDARTKTGQGTHVGAIGLGIGTVACYRAPKRKFTFFEINPAVIRMAKDPSLFTFLAKCPGASIVEGDGRLSLVQIPKGTYDLLFLDAFTADSIPVHLLTREAFSIYMDRLRPQGVLAVHISNRYMNLAPVVGAIARDLGLVTAMRVGENTTVPGTQLPSTQAQVVVLARRADALAGLMKDKGWNLLTEPPGRPAWTDNYSNIMSVLRFK